MKNLIITITALSLVGCSTISSKETFATCKTIDIATTAYGLHTGAVVEANPISAAIIGKVGMLGFAGLSLGLVYLVWKHEQDIHKPTLTALNIVTCAAAINNAVILK